MISEYIRSRNKFLMLSSLVGENQIKIRSSRIEKKMIYAVNPDSNAVGRLFVLKNFLSTPPFPFYDQI